MDGILNVVNGEGVMNKLITKKRIKTIFLSLLILLLSIITVELIANFKVLILNEENKGVLQVETVSDVQGGDIENGVFVLNEDNSSVLWNLNGQYVDKFAVSYNSESMFNATVSIGAVNSFGKEEVQTYAEGNPIELTQSVIDINSNVNWIQYSFSDAKTNKIELFDPIIINNVQININRVFVTFCTVLSAILLIHFRKFISKHLEIGFLVLSLCMGLGILTCLPANKVSWDEEIHFSRSYRLALIPGEVELPEEIAGYLSATDYNWPWVQPGAKEEAVELSETLNSIYETGEKTQSIFGWTSGIYTPGYVFEAVGIKIAQIFGGSFTDILFAGRLASLISFVVVMFFAIKILPIGKEILLFISCMPTTIFLAVTYNYDIAIFAFISLGISIILREWLCKDRSVNIKWLLISIPILAFGCLPKAVYAPLVLLPLMIPNARFKNNKIAVRIKCAFVILCITLLALFIVPQIVGNRVSDPRGGDVDASTQLKLMLSNPITYIGVFFENVKSTFSSYVFGEAQYRALGHLNSSGFAYFIPFMAGSLLLSAEIDDQQIEFNWKKRVYILFLIFLIVGLIWTALYLSYTVPGSSTIAGVQGRYYKPVLLLFYLVLCPFRVHLNVSKVSYRMIILGICLTILSVAAFENFLPMCI